MHKCKTLFLLLLIVAFNLYAVPYEIDLSGGTGGAYQSTVYTAPNGTVVTASSGAYSNGYYEMKHMFNNTFGNGIDQYWLPLTGATTTLVINLNQIYYLTGIRVFVNTMYSHHQSKYQMEISPDGVNYTNITGSYISTGMSYDNTWAINTNVDYIRFTLVSTTDWLTINEIELFAENVVPEPSTFILAIMALVFFVRYRKI